MAGSSGEQRSVWASNVQHTLQIMREEFDTGVDVKFRILKVSEPDRQPAAEFTPQEWRFGLHNRDRNVDMSDSEAAKRAIVVLFGLDEPLRWKSFCDDVVLDPRAMLQCYGLHKEVNDLLKEEIKQVLAFDALFLAVRMELEQPVESRSRKLVPVGQWNSMKWHYFSHTFWTCYDMVMHDLCKIENQIPFDLIKRAINHVQEFVPQGSIREVEEVPIDQYDLEKWMRCAIRCGIFQFMEISDNFYEGATWMLLQSHHILDATYKVICGVQGINQICDFSEEDYIHVPSATKLKECGIKIEGVARPLSGMSYDKKKKCLYLPKMIIFDSTVSLVRNMARYEHYTMRESTSENRCAFHDYVILMLDLMQTPLDLNHLVKNGVIRNECGHKGVQVWRALDEGLGLMPSLKEHNKMKRDINERCKLMRPRMWSEFKTLFLSRPWLTISVVAITLVTLATLIQTYVAVISSNRMKPQFKP